MQFIVATHGHCFDGLASAVAFTRLMRSTEHQNAQFIYRGCGYGPAQQKAGPQMLVGDENAILDYRFSPCEAVTWFFDHHRTAFAAPEERDVFEAREPSGRYFFDPAYSSCTKLIADVSAERFGVQMPELGPLIRWADIVDSAAFDSAEQAIDKTNSVMRLVSVVEHYADDALINQLVPKLLESPLEEVANLGDVRRRGRSIEKRQSRFIRRVEQKAQELGRVVLVDLTDEVIDTVGKFVTYALFPSATYSVVVALLKNGVKISVGYNPWSGKSSDVDISAICARHGGGGHRVVGAIPFPSTEVERARLVARQIAAELDGEHRP